MAVSVEHEDAFVAVKVPAGEGAGSFFNVGLGVAVADTHREEFQQLPAIILVGPALAVLGPIEPDQHGRVARDGLEHGAEVAKRVGAEGLVLRPHPARVVHFVVCRREVVVPEQRQLLFEGPRRVGHAVHPPLADTADVVEVHIVALDARENGLERIGDGLRVEQAARRPGNAQAGIFGPFRGPGAKARAPKQVGELSGISGGQSHRVASKGAGTARCVRDRIGHGRFIIPKVH